MKPSERRALEAEQRAQREAEQREKLLEAKSKRQERPSEIEKETERIYPQAAYRKLPEEEIEVKGDGYHREGFFGSHVKLITFIVCMAVILTVLGPWGIDMLVDRGRQEIFGNEVENKQDLTVDGVKLLADMGDTVTWDSLRNLSYTDYSYEKEGKTNYIREYEVVGTPLVLRVGGTSLVASPDYVRLIDYESGDFVEDIRRDSVAAFLAKYTK